MDDVTELAYSEIEKAREIKGVWVSIEPYFSYRKTILQDEFINLQSSDTENMRVIHCKLAALEDLKSQIHRFIETGKLAEIKLGERNGSN